MSQRQPEVILCCAVGMEHENIILGLGNTFVSLVEIKITNVVTPTDLLITITIIACTF